MIREMCEFFLYFTGACVIAAAIFIIAFYIVGMLLEMFDRHPVETSIVTGVILLATIILSVVIIL